MIVESSLRFGICDNAQSINASALGAIFGIKLPNPLISSGRGTSRYNAIGNSEGKGMNKYLK
jgi:hypothetical protein